MSWVIYLISDEEVYCWTSTGALVGIATLGFTKVICWMGVYREMAVLPERHFPVPMVLAHGILAVTTVVLVVLTVLGQILRRLASGDLRGFPPVPGLALQARTG